MADPTLTPDAIDAWIGPQEGWSVQDGRLHRELQFRDFTQAFGFMAEVALVAERMDHHPDWSNVWNRVVIDIASHDAGGITARCTLLAEAVDRAAAARPAS